MTHPDRQSRARIGRKRRNANYDRAALFAILDEAFLCHVSFALDGQPYVLPMAFARRDDAIVLHGSVRGRMMKIGRAHV